MNRRITIVRLGAGAAILCSGLIWWSLRSGLPMQASAAAPVAGSIAPSAAASHGRSFRVLHIMSYDSSWAEWTVVQFDAFKQALAGLPVEYKVIEMDVKRNTSDAWKKQITAEARNVIDSWMPDLVYTSDDFVQSSVVKQYLNSDIPFVFSGVNADPATYGFAGSKNVTGVLEREHIVQTARLLTSIAPNVKRLAVISDTGETWPSVIRRIRESEKEMGLTVVAADVVNTFDEYQQKIRGYAGNADAICTLGVFTLKDRDGKHVTMRQVGRWTYENCSLPNVSFWDSRPPIGVLCAVCVSATAQGTGAGETARQILVNGRQPCDFEIKPTQRGQPIVNIGVARHLGLKAPSTVLLTAKVISKCEWE